jgi:hypothetical protein
LNVIFDLGIFFGECVIGRNRRLSWDYRPGASEDGSSNLSGYDIVGFKNRRDWLDPVGTIFRACLQAEDDLRLQRVPGLWRGETLVGVVRDYSTR